MFWENSDFLAVRQGEGVFKNIGPAELIGCFNCGGCPGKRIVDRAKLLVKGGADVIALSASMHNSCDGHGVCPFYDTIQKTLANQLGSIIIVDPTTRRGV
jgi:predicted metal-binding protein